MMINCDSRNDDLKPPTVGAFSEAGTWCLITGFGWSAHIRSVMCVKTSICPNLEAEMGSQDMWRMLNSISPVKVETSIFWKPNKMIKWNDQIQ